MRALVITIAASAAILFLILAGWSANAVTGPGPSKERVACPLWVISGHNCEQNENCGSVNCTVLN